ncbi:MAG: hypothetical protein AAF587_16090, partial [Bacteroidota bacterium]
MNQNHIKELARSRARDLLSNHASFKHMPADQQREMYKQVVSEQMMHIMEDDGTPYARELRTTGSQRPANRTPRDYQQAAEDFS